MSDGSTAAATGLRSAAANAVTWFLDRHVGEGRGAATAFTDPARRLSYAELVTASTAFATALRAAGLRPEQRLALLLLDTVDFPIAFWGALRAGVVPVPVNTLLPPDQVAYILDDCRAAAVCLSAPLLPAYGAVVAASQHRPRLWVAAAAGGAPAGLPAGATGFDAALAAATPAVAATEPASADEVAFWLYSSGSTGAPKGVKHLHGSLRATAETYARQVLGIRADDIVFSAAKFFFAYGLGNALTFPMSVGAQAVLLPGRPTPDAVAAVMAAHRPTIFCGVPTLYAGMLATPGLGAGAGSDRLRRCISAGEALPEAVAAAWSDRVGTEILDGIGSTEMLHIFLSNRPGAVTPGATGRAVPGYDLRIVDEAERDVPPGEIGELLVRGPSAAEGYWRQRDKTRRTFAGEWVRTGDKYVQDAAGVYFYKGRADDMFKVSGIWVSPFEVEAALAAHPAVQEAAVIGREDADGLVKPMAFVVLKPGAEADEASLQAAVKARCGPWAYPRWIARRDDLPKTATGKIQRFRLRDGLGA